MNLNYLSEVVVPQRKKEIEEEKNLATRQPIYVVLDLVEQFVSGHNEYSLQSNHKGVQQEFGYIESWSDIEERVFKVSDEEMEAPEPVTRIFTDRFVAFFLTSKSAHEYLEHQSHNLENPYVYVFYSGYKNFEMDSILEGE